MEHTKSERDPKFRETPGKHQFGIIILMRLKSESEYAYSL